MQSPSRAVFTPPWPAGRLDRLDQRITNALAVAAVPSLRIAMGIVFLWSQCSSSSPERVPLRDSQRARSRDGVGIVAPAIAVPLLGAWKVAIGIGLLDRLVPPGDIAAAGTADGRRDVALSIVFPSETFDGSPLIPMLEGQYIIKNVHSSRQPWSSVRRCAAAHCSRHPLCPRALRTSPRRPGDPA